MAMGRRRHLNANANLRENFFIAKKSDSVLAARRFSGYPALRSTCPARRRETSSDSRKHCAAVVIFIPCIRAPDLRPSPRSFGAIARRAVIMVARGCRRGGASTLH
jgi:hypothetical protein